MVFANVFFTSSSAGQGLVAKLAANSVLLDLQDVALAKPQRLRLGYPLVNLTIHFGGIIVRGLLSCKWNLQHNMAQQVEKICKRKLKETEAPSHGGAVKISVCIIPSYSGVSHGGGGGFSFFAQPPKLASCRMFVKANVPKVPIS